MQFRSIQISVAAILLLVASHTSHGQDAEFIFAEASGDLNVSPIEGSSLQNGDFTIIGVVDDRPVGDGEDEDTFWTFGEWKWSDDSTPFTGSFSEVVGVQNVILTLQIRTSDGTVETDDVGFEAEGFSNIDLGDVQPIPKESIVDFTMDFLVFPDRGYTEEHVVEFLRGVSGQIPMRFHDDALVFYAKLEIGIIRQGLEITAPARDEFVIAGEDYTIRWNSTGIDSVIISYVEDSGGPGEIQHQVADGVDAATGEYVWSVPDTILERKAGIYIIDAGDSFADDSSDKFRIKGYVLTRVDQNADYEAFDPERHGWGFCNCDGKLEPPTYADTTQFEYFLATGRDPFTGAPYDVKFYTSPVQAERTDFPDWPSFVRAFGTDDAYWGAPINRTYRENAIRSWHTDISRRTPWGGSCSGMSMSALLAFIDKGRFGQDNPGIGAVDELYGVVSSTATVPDHVRQTINRLFVYWHGGLQTSHAGSHTSDTPRQTLDNLKAMLLDEQETYAKAGYLYIRNPSDPVLAHAVAPIKLTRTSLSLGQYDLSIYDPNLPGQVSTIKIDSMANNWSYPPDYGLNTRGFYLMDSYVNYLGEATPQFEAVRSGKGSVDEDNVLFVPATWANVQIGSESGVIGYADGAAFNTIDGADFSVNPTGYASSPESYRVPDGAYNIALREFSGSASSLATKRGSAILDYIRFDAAADQTDHLFFDGGLGTSNHDSESKRIYFKTIFSFEDHERVMEIRGFPLDEGDSTYVATEEDGMLQLENFGGADNYDLVLRRADTDTVLRFHSVRVPIGSGARHRIPPNWDNLDSMPVEIDIDADGDGIYESSMQVKSNVAVEDLGIRSDELPSRFDLKQNYPNPFNPSTTIAYDVPIESDVSIMIFDALGRLVEELGTWHRAPGRYTATWSADAYPSGVYFYRLETNGITLTRSMTVMK